ncbi:hypothetical protein BGW80DRAFT_1459873 [Lactifluus volemus]|nr:hypothetical protein BGW80DRAFT_1459873 [Lactifluus volemus]
MSQLVGQEHETLHVIDNGTANGQLESVATDQASRMDDNHRPRSDRRGDDSSGALFSLYQDITEEEDKQRAKRWQKDADGILVFTGLLSVAAVTLLTVTIPDLKNDPQTTSAFYIRQLFELQLAVYHNQSTRFIPDQPPSSSLPSTSVIANAFLFMCLSLNIFSAMLALLLQQWTRQYFILSHSPQFSSETRARVREVLGGSQKKSPIILAFQVSMASVFLSLTLFCLALTDYLILHNRAVQLCFYICSLICFLIVFFINFMHRVVSKQSFLANSRASPLLLFVLPLVWKSTMEIDDRIQDQILKTLKPENSDLVRLGKEKVIMAMKNLMERIWSSNSLSDSEKTRRVVACVEVADALRLSDVASSILEIIFPRDHHQLLQSVEFGRSLRNQGQEKIGLCAQSLVSGIISNVQSGDDRWIALAADQLGKSEDVIRDYLEHGHENLLLANLTHITRQIFVSEDRDMASASSIILPTLSKFDVSNTFPGLKYDFFVLWDEIDREAPNNRVLTKISNDLHHLHQTLNRLPPGWETRRTPQGLIYYVDHNTRSTSWTHPTIIEGLPPGWDVRRTQGGRIYYVDHNTRSTTFTRPSYSPPHNPPHTPQAAPSLEVTQQSSSHLNAERLRLESDGRSQAGPSQPIVAFSVTTTAVNITHSSGEHPTVQLDPTSGVLHASTHFPTNVSMASASSPPLGARHDSGEPDDSIEMRSSPVS